MARIEHDPDLAIFEQDWRTDGISVIERRHDHEHPICQAAQLEGNRQRLIAMAAAPELLRRLWELVQIAEEAGHDCGYERSLLQDLDPHGIGGIAGGARRGARTGVNGRTAPR